MVFGGGADAAEEIGRAAEQVFALLGGADDAQREVFASADARGAKARAGPAMGSTIGGWRIGARGRTPFTTESGDENSAGFDKKSSKTGKLHRWIDTIRAAFCPRDE